ncbi:hypothetical protein LshimejAT787_0410920 [Lyophyllum shimeji]|uniref:Uncharacterized protein n=1 Tax=Lyophyllum shimeji TaxID=47721 RepID=A0A9P3PMI7_LYOSH|nr:hypothetical protein LshimejAT787_0410920 [Lyophyllum shimeji]
MSQSVRMQLEPASHSLMAPVPSAVPPGYAAITASGRTYLCPEFLKPLVTFDTLKENRGPVLEHNPQPPTEPACIFLGGEGIPYPPDPPVSIREGLQLHDEIQAIKQKEGLSYAAAARLLYLVEVSKVETATRALAAFKQLTDDIENYVA